MIRREAEAVMSHLVNFSPRLKDKEEQGREIKGKGATMM